MAQKTIDPLAKLSAKTTKFSLNPAASRNARKGLYEALAEFPVALFACKSLVELEIFRGTTATEIPEGIGALTKLKVLSLGGLRVAALPESIGQLKKLEELSLAYMDELTTLPDSVAKLTKLVVLSAPYAGFTSLPPLGALKKLRSLNLWENRRLRSVPASLWDCSALEDLQLPDSVQEFPAGISKLKKLKSLTCGPNALTSVARELPKLKIAKLRVWGKATSVPDEIGAIPTLKSIELDYLGLTSLPPAFPFVEALSVSGNALTSVKGVLAGAPKLKVFSFSGNQLSEIEKREVGALMKKSPAKRALASPR